MTPATDTPAAAVFPLSMFDPVHLGVDENGEHVFVDLAERNMLLGGEPGGGKSNALNLIVAHAALSADCQLILVDGKQVELGPWRHCADGFIGPSLDAAIAAFATFQQVMNDRYVKLLAGGRRKITRGDGEPVYRVVIDEYAYYSATVGKKQDRERFAELARDLVARGRAAGVIVILATQRPSHQVIDPSLRDLFGYRWAFRCTTDSSSDIVLGQGWAKEGYNAAEIGPLARGVGWLLSETGVPRRIKAAWRLGRSEACGRSLRKWAHMLGFGGHFLTKSRRYSITFGQLRKARTDHRRAARHPDGERDPWGRPLDDTVVLVLKTWTITGTGYSTMAEADLAAAAAARAREHDEWPARAA